MNYTEMLFNRDERLVNLLNQADSKNLELIEEINNREDEIERLNNIINEINSIVEYWGYDKEHNDISSFRMAMKSIKDVLGSDK